MADPLWLEKDSLIAEILNSPENFDYFQALRLLTLAHGPDFPSNQAFLETGLTTRASSSLAMPASDLVEAEALFDLKKDEDLDFRRPLYRLTAAFLGLYGLASPLPAFYSQTVLEEAKDDERAIRDFLDLLAAPFYRLHALGHFRGQLGLRVVELADPHEPRILWDLAGPKTNADDRGPQVASLALWTRYARSAQSLTRLLENLIGLPVILEPFVPRTLALPTEARAQLGQGPALGEGLLLGSETTSLRTKFNLRIAPPTKDLFLELLPRGSLRAQVEGLINDYNQESLDYEFLLFYQPQPEEALVLGGGLALGRDAFLGPFNERTFKIYSPPLKPEQKFSQAASMGPIDFLADEIEADKAFL
ncbi:MAG: type VI secretion system baseplate subunit TssG [Deltaproteobacteria bacterium]|jgi:type VI secretion system protein ImpH|nr:type VI secretion system baseplate subunit TssG [Deltaproteobacteria bacterium]